MRLPRRRTKEEPLGPAQHPDPQRILTEYVLHMSIKCLGDEDVTPLYQEYLQDGRLGASERAELTAVYQTLVPRSSAMPAA